MILSDALTSSYASPELINLWISIIRLMDLHESNHGDPS